MASLTNFALDQGSDFEAQVQVKDTFGTPRNLTNYTFAAQMRRSFTSSTATSFTVAAVDLTVGRIGLTLTNAVTSTLKSGNYVFDVEMTDPSGKKTRILEGQITVFAEVTR
jgi:hypothetical protein